MAVFPVWWGFSFFLPRNSVCFFIITYFPIFRKGLFFVFSFSLCAIRLIGLAGLLLCPALPGGPSFVLKQKKQKAIQEKLFLFIPAVVERCHANLPARPPETSAVVTWAHYLCAPVKATPSRPLFAAVLSAGRGGRCELHPSTTDGIRP